MKFLLCTLLLSSMALAGENTKELQYLVLLKSSVVVTTEDTLSQIKEVTNTFNDYKMGGASGIDACIVEIKHLRAVLASSLIGYQSEGLFQSNTEDELVQKYSGALKIIVQTTVTRDYSLDKCIEWHKDFIKNLSKDGKVEVLQLGGPSVDPSVTGHN